MRRISILFSIAMFGCNQGAPSGGEDKDSEGYDDIAEALRQLPEAVVIERHADSMPMFVIGELAKVDAMQNDDVAAADTALRVSLPPVLKVFRLENTDLVLRKLNVDEDGGRHFRYDQVHAGLPVIGGDLVVHVDIKGAIHAVNGTARGDISDQLGASGITQNAAVSAILQDSRFAGLSSTAPRAVYIQTAEGTIFKAFEVVVEGTRGADPARDKVYVDVDSGTIVAVYPQIHFARNRRIYTANNGTSLPGTLKRTEGQAAASDAAVNASYDNAGATYDAYANFWNRDSFDGAGATLTQSVHYSTNYCNAFWNGTQMVYGDGNAAEGCGSLALSLDVTGHEMTHAVTERESGLVYSGESGGINEAFSDMFGSFVEAWVDGGRNGTLSNGADVWLIGDEVLPPYLRNMCDPAADGASRDVWSSTLANVDVHYSSGPANLMFCLLSKGGHHPRGKTSNNVPGIGMAKAIRIVYKAQTDILTSTAKYSNLRTAMEQATTSLGFDQATKDAVGCAFAAISVGTAPASCGGSTPPPPPPGEGVLSNGVPIPNLSDATGGQKVWRIDVPVGQTSMTISIAGGSGDADLYVQSGSAPTTTVYQCRPYKNGNAETCTFSPPSQGTYYVMLNAYAAYSGLTLTGTYSATQSGDPYLTNGTGVGVSGAANSAGYWRITTPAGKTLTVKMTGGTGDADLYTQFGARPTTTSYACRPYLNGNNETCTTSSTSAGDYYVMVRGYSAFSGATLVASY
jgi:vibriolysin